MLRAAPAVAAGALVAGVFAIAVTGPAAIAAATKCLTKANRVVACTDQLRNNTQVRRLRFHPKLDASGRVEPSARRGPWLRGQ